MVSFWPFKGDDNSAASFEKVLSQLSTKINKVSARNDRFRQNQRRYKVLWLLYSTFAYILMAAILTLVTGWDKWGAGEISAMAGGPVLIYLIRTGLDTYYNYRLANTQNQLNNLSKQREAAIERLKQATKYNSTQQLLEKYGGTPPSKQPSPSSQAKGKRSSDIGPGSKPSSRTGFAPPPTANIPGRQSLPAPNQQQGALHSKSKSAPQGGRPASGTQDVPGEEFAPNAFTTAPQNALQAPPHMRQVAQYATEGPKWYDRILDVVLGDDETQAKNRIALICANCRLVNGQAPPGARTLEDVGKWKCSSCGAMNGVESEEKKILQHIAKTEVEPVSPIDVAIEHGSAEEHEESADDVEHDGVDGLEGSSPAASTRSKSRQKTKA